MTEPRCPECGSWDRECISPTPIADCGCNRCMRAELEEAERLLLSTRRDLMRLNQQVSTFGLAATILGRIDAFLNRASPELGV